MNNSEEIKVTFLGTGTSQGVPVITCKCPICCSVNPKDKRLRSSILLETKGKTFVIDTGPDFRQQMLRAKVEKLDAVIFTHEHKDHIAGLDDVRAFNYFTQKPIEIYATDKVQEAIRREFHYAFGDEKYPGVPELNLNRIENNPFEVENVLFNPIEVLHYKMHVLGFRIGDFTYITDANYISDKEKEKIKGSKVLVLNALRKKTHLSHFNLDEALELVRELKPEKAYFTHISHLLGKHEEVTEELPEGVALAFDGLQITIN